MIDRTARRYGKWPHQVLELDGFQQGLAALCMERAGKRLGTQLRASKGAIPAVAVVVEP